MEQQLLHNRHWTLVGQPVVVVRDLSSENGFALDFPFPEDGMQQNRLCMLVMRRKTIGRAFVSSLTVIMAEYVSA